MPFFNVNYTLPISNRTQMRLDLINLFSNEQPGTGKGDNASKYLYDVESFGAYKIQLERPARLNKGFDFVVHVNNIYFMYKDKLFTYPRHDDVLSALTYCSQNYNDYQTVIVPIINDIYNCIDFVMPQTGKTFPDYNGAHHPIEIILLALKWLFMEQDITYWNYSGRHMLYSKLIENNLV